MSDSPKSCPKCNCPYIYVGANVIECGLDPSCENYTETQRKVVNDILSKKFPSSWNVKDTKPPPAQIEFDYDDLPDTIPMGVLKK